MDVHQKYRLGERWFPIHTHGVVRQAARGQPRVGKATLQRLGRPNQTPV